MSIQVAAICMVVCGLTAVRAQDSRLSDADLRELSGRWVGTVVADIGEMPIALKLEIKDARLHGVLETAHGSWNVQAVRKTAGTWIVKVKTPDGLEGTLSGRIKDERLTGEWNFKPRAVGTFALARPATTQK
jgi:hypothetical protein